MPYKLSKSMIDDFHALTDSMQSHVKQLAEAVETYNQAVDEARAELQEKIDEFNGSQTDMRDFIETNIVDAWQDKYDSKSEKWQESAAGSDAHAQIEEWADRRDSMDDIEIDTPDPLEIETADFDEWPQYDDE